MADFFRHSSTFSIFSLTHLNNTFDNTYFLSSFTLFYSTLFSIPWAFGDLSTPFPIGFSGLTFYLVVFVNYSGLVAYFLALQGLFHTISLSIFPFFPVCLSDSFKKWPEAGDRHLLLDFGGLFFQLHPMDLLLSIVAKLLKGSNESCSPLPSDKGMTFLILSHQISYKFFSVLINMPCIGFWVTFFAHSFQLPNALPFIC